MKESRDYTNTNRRTYMLSAHRNDYFLDQYYNITEHLNVRLTLNLKIYIYS
jgi:hypothetical protein